MIMSVRHNLKITSFILLILFACLLAATSFHHCAEDVDVASCPDCQAKESMNSVIPGHFTLEFVQDVVHSITSDH